MSEIILMDVTDKNREALVNLTLSMFLGEKCKYCLKKFETLKDLEDTIWAGSHKYGRLAHEKCWNKYKGETNG